MANPVKGEVSFSHGEEDYVLVLDVNAICDLEDQGIYLADLAKPTFKTLRAMIHAGLQEHHEGVTARDAGKILDGLGLGKAVDVLTKAAKAAGWASDVESKPRPPVRTGKKPPP